MSESTTGVLLIGSSVLCSGAIRFFGWRNVCFDIPGSVLKGCLGLFPVSNSFGKFFWVVCHTAMGCEPSSLVSAWFSWTFGFVATVL